jgi:hypothetical protein
VLLDDGWMGFFSFKGFFYFLFFILLEEMLFELLGSLYRCFLLLRLDRGFFVDIAIARLRLDWMDSSFFAEC